MHLHVIGQQESGSGLRGLTAALGSLGHTATHDVVPGTTIAAAADLGHLLAGRALVRSADVVLASGWLAGLVGQIITRDTQTPVVQRLFSPGRSPDQHRRRLEGALARGAARTLALCNDDVDQLVGLGVRRSDIRVVPHGVDTTLFRDTGPRWPAAAGVPRVVACPGADQPSVARLLSLLPALPRAELILLTGSATRAVVTSAVSAAVARHPVGQRVRVLALGELAEVDRDGTAHETQTLPALLRSAGVVVTTGDDEQELELALQAMACGVPVVARSSGTMADVVADAVTGVLVSRGSPDALAQAVRGLLGDELRRESFGFAAGDRARAAFAWPAVATMLSRVTAEVTGHSDVDVLSG